MIWWFGLWLLVALFMIGMERYIAHRDAVHCDNIRRLMEQPSPFGHISRADPDDAEAWGGGSDEHS